MKTLLASLALLAGSAHRATADGWIDCNGPDKNGRGCNASGVDTAATVTGLGLVAAVAAGIGRKRRK